MNIKQLLIGATVLMSILCGRALASDITGAFVRIAELEIDVTQLASFESAIKEGVETAVREEPGVLALYAVSEKDNPSRVIVIEIYTDANAYAAHLETPHFKKFRATTDNMVKSRKLIDTVPILLAAKVAAASH